MTLQSYRDQLVEFVKTTFPEENMAPVFGDGDIEARVMMIGEAPGEQEMLQGRPFVGKAGKNLDAFLKAAGMDRRELYVTNTVKIRPWRLSKANRIVNRPPTRREIELFLPWLEREIDLIDPVCIITLGNVPLKALAGEDSSIGSIHGVIIPWRSRWLYPMYHPASMIYNPSLRTVYQQDIERFSRCFRELPGRH